MKVSVKIWSMNSDSGYVSSLGSCKAAIVPAAAIAKLAGNEKALYDIAGDYPEIKEDALEDSQPIGWKSGACNYQGSEGIIEVPDGQSVVQFEYQDISTRDEVQYSAWVVNGDSLKALYKERAEMYARLAE